MKVFKYIKSVSLILFCSLIMTTSTVCQDSAFAQPATTQPAVQTGQSLTVKPLAIVASPKSYLGRNVVMNAKFDKFSTLGLDYKPAFRSSDDYISFLIQRDDTKHNIPLSEMKLFLKRELAEKFIDLKTGDEIEIQGRVFSEALGDAWLDVSNIRILNKVKEEQKNGEK